MVIILKLINILNTNKNTRKIFGKKELEIIFKQLNGTILTQSEKNRLSRDIKPKFEFIKEISKSQEEFKLEKNQDNKKIIEKAVEIILNDQISHNIKTILLFGSFADNTSTNKSDIDICVIFRKNISLKEATRFRIMISAQLSEKVDIQVFNILPQKIKREIARNHRVLYKTKDYDNLGFSIRYLKDDDYFIRMNKIFAPP